MAYDFDKIVNRRGTDSTKWDADPNLFIENIDYKIDKENILPLWIADMDFEVLPEITEALIKRASHGVFGYTEMSDKCYDAIINWEDTRHDFKIKREWLEFTSGAVTAAHVAVQAFTQPGDKVIIQPPVYYPFYRTVSNNGANLLLNNLILNEKTGKYEIDFEDFERKAKDPRTTLFILCSPHNPVCRVWTRGELERLSKICADNNVKVVADELHCDLVMPGFKHTPIASLNDESLNNTVTIIAPSKTFNIAGIQATVNIIANDDMRQKFNNALMRSSLTRLNLFAMTAMEAAFAHGAKWVDELINYIYKNYEFLVKYAAEKLPKVKVMPLEGTYLAWLDFRAYKLSNYDLQKKMLTEAKLWLDEGYVFGDTASGFERVVLACPRSYIKEAVDRMAKAFN